MVVPDNLRAGVARAHRYEPDINPTYQDLATHYGVAIVPARVRRPRDKSKAEVGVQVVERWILAALRHRQCFSLAELNRAIHTLLKTLNRRPFRKLPGSRHTLFAQLDKPVVFFMVTTGITVTYPCISSVASSCFYVDPSRYPPVFSQWSTQVHPLNRIHALTRTGTEPYLADFNTC